MNLKLADLIQKLKYIYFKNRYIEIQIYTFLKLLYFLEILEVAIICQISHAHSIILGFSRMVKEHKFDEIVWILQYKNKEHIITIYRKQMQF